MARRGRDNFRFTTVELSALALSFTATSVLVFLLGFYVGRRVAAEHVPVGENVARVPVGSPPSDDAPIRPQARPAAPAAAQGSTPASQVATASKPAANQPATQGTGASKAGSAAPLQTSAKPSASPSVAAQAAAQPGPASPARPVPAPMPPPPVAQAPPGVPYTVQVLATRNKNEAETLTNNLKRRGLGAYLVQVDDAGGAWYRVRIGNYDSPDAARRTADRASKELGLTQAYVIPLTSSSR